jgi:hypothetical protein
VSRIVIYLAAQKGRGDKAAWVRHAYQDVLARAPAAAEENDWLQFLG